MPFAEEIKKKFIPEWSPFYADYTNLSKLLSPYAKLHKGSKLDPGIRNNIDINSLEEFDLYFEKYLFSELKKVSQFFKVKLDDSINKFKTILINLAIYKEESTADPKHQERKRILKEAFHLYMKELKYLNDYYQVNHTIFRRALEKHRKYVNSMHNNQLEELFFRVMTTSNLVIQKARLSKLKDYVKSLYLQQFYKPHQLKEGIEEIKKIHLGTSVTQQETWLFGLFSGFALALFLGIVILSAKNLLSLNESNIKNEFPIFRGATAFIFYVWVLAWNIWAWQKCNIDYKLIFGFCPDHYSTLPQIMKRASFFTLVFLIMMLWFMIIVSNPKSEISEGLNSIIPYQWTGFIIWITFLGYLFFPSFKTLNGTGRKYLLTQLLKTLFGMFLPITYTMKFIAIQSSSFVLPLKDLSYTICYYTHYDDQNFDLSSCQNPANFLVAIFLSLLPNVFLDLIFIKIWYQDGRFCSAITSFVGTITVSGLTSLVSYFYLAFQTNAMFYFWIVISIISSLYAWYIDVKYCFGFLDPNTKRKLLRPVMAYPHIWMYYACFFGNLLLRYIWTLTISPSIYISFMKPQLFQLILMNVEIFRRGIWNIFAVEFQHVLNLGIFRAIPDLKLPYSTLRINIDDACTFQFTREVENFQQIINPKDIEKEIMDYNMSITTLSHIDEDTYKLRHQNEKKGIQENRSCDKEKKAFTTINPEEYEKKEYKRPRKTTSIVGNNIQVTPQKPEGICHLLWLDDELKYNKDDLEKMLTCVFPIDVWVKEAKECMNKITRMIGERKIKHDARSPEIKSLPLNRRKMTFIQGVKIDKDGDNIYVNPDQLIRHKNDKFLTREIIRRISNSRLSMMSTTEKRKPYKRFPADSKPESFSIEIQDSFVPIERSEHPHEVR